MTGYGCRTEVNGGDKVVRVLGTPATRRGLRVHARGEQQHPHLRENNVRAVEDGGNAGRACAGDDGDADSVVDSGRGYKTVAR
jgi:hypothetical protein